MRKRHFIISNAIMDLQSNSTGISYCYNHIFMPILDQLKTCFYIDQQTLFNK